jgi:hypothetical protein
MTSCSLHLSLASVNCKHNAAIRVLKSPEIRYKKFKKTNKTGLGTPLQNTAENDPKTLKHGLTQCSGLELGVAL